MPTKPKSNHILFRIIKFLYENFIVILPLLVGLNLLLQYSNTNELTVYLYKSSEENGLHVAEFEIYNEGNPISKLELIQPLIINLKEDNTIVDFNLIVKKPEVIKVWFSKLKQHKLKVDFDLLNESESIRFNITTRKPIAEFTVSSRIKNLEEVTTYHHEVKPKVYDRVGKFWIFLLLFSVITFLDALALVGKDKQLKALLTLINNLDITQDKLSFLKEYERLYQEYQVKFKRNREGILTDVKQVLVELNEENIEEGKAKIKSITKKSVLYNLRKPYLLISPVVFLVSLIAIIASVVYYAIF